MVEESLRQNEFAPDWSALSFTADGQLRFKTEVQAEPWSGGANSQLLAGNIFVFSPNAYDLFAVSAVDGKILWHQSAAQIAGAAEQAASRIQSLAAGSDGSLWVVMSQAETLQMQSEVPEQAVLSVLNATDGSRRWSRTEINRHGLAIVLDAANRGYLTSGSSGFASSWTRQLDALSSTGQVRWTRYVDGTARAVFNGVIELSNGATLSTVDGAAKWLPLWASEPSF